MRKLWMSAVALVVLMLGAATARADGLLYRLPEDGSWVRFDLEGVRGAGGGQVALGGSLTMASVGRVHEGGEDCRWIELTWKLEEKTGNSAVVRVIAKVLIPEKHLKPGENPLEHIVRGWAQVDGGPPMDVNENPIAPYMLPGALAGPLQDVKPLDAAKIGSQLGQLDCDGLTGSTTYAHGPFEVQADFDVRRHEAAPFGVVTARVISRYRQDGTVTLTVNENLTLAEAGTGAESALPGYE